MMMIVNNFVENKPNRHQRWINQDKIPFFVILRLRPSLITFIRKKLVQIKYKKNIRVNKKKTSIWIKHTNQHRKKIV